MGDQNVLYTTPTGEHITARRSTRAKFLQLESAQLHAYISDLESSLRTNKALLKDLVTSIKSQIPLDKQLVMRVISSIEEENAILEERARRVVIEKNDALFKAQSSDRVIADTLARESLSTNPYEAKLTQRRAELEEKEGKVQELDSRCKELLEEVEDGQKLCEAQTTSQADLDLTMAEKYARLKTIYEKLLRELEKSTHGKEEMEETCRGLLTELQKVNSVLKSPISRARNLEELLQSSANSAPYDNIPLEESFEADLPPPHCLSKHLAALKTHQHRKTLSQRIPSPLGSFSSQSEQK